MSLGKSIGRNRLEHAWSTQPSRAGAWLMTPLAYGYRQLMSAREWLYRRRLLTSRRLACPVVSVGNLTVGGSGKTPAVMLAAETLIALGRRPAVVSRGYGRLTRGVQVVADTASIRLDADEGGDEPFLLARRLPGVPVVVGGNRWEAARLAVQRFGVDAIVIDDGFQHRTVAKDLDIVMVRAHAPWGNGRLLPAGPLREPLDALARADLIVVTGAADPADADPVAKTVAAYAPGVPVLPAAYTATECWETSPMTAVPLERLRGVRTLAFAGLGSPAAFARTLANLGVVVEEFVPFGDHHRYAQRELDALAARATARNADGLVTTEKDWVRLRHLRISGLPLWVVAVRLTLLVEAWRWRSGFERVCRIA